MTNAEQSKIAAQGGERECRQTADDRALALVTARFLATHRLFFLLNLLQLAVCLTIFTNFAVIAGFLTAFAGLFYLHVRLHFDTLIFRDFADGRLDCGKFDAVCCVGAVIRGSTPHFDYVSAETTKGIANVTRKYGKPVTFGVLTVDSIEQAIERAGSKAGNKGFEAMTGVIEMLSLYKNLEA